MFQLWNHFTAGVSLLKAAEQIYYDSHITLLYMNLKSNFNDFLSSL
jgi:hypothetical protein